MKKLLLIASLLCTVFVLSAQQIYVQGIVTDSSGNGVPNATVVISNPILGAGMAVGWSQTDASGSYWWLDSINAFSLSQPGLVDVSIADCNGTVFSQSLAYTPNLSSLTANFSPICTGSPGGNNCGVNIPLPFIGNGSISITANGTGGVAPYTYLWDMGDSSVYTTQTANHTYTANGTYSVCVVIIDATGCVATQCMPVTITGATGGGNCAVYMGYMQGNAPNVINFTGQGSATGSLSYTWDFGDGNTSTLQSPTHTYAVDTAYYVCVTVVDNVTGCTATDCGFVYVVGVTTCQALIQYSNVPGSMNVDFFGLSTGTAPFTYAWDFGDGSTSTVQNPSHLYSTIATGPVNFSVTLTVTDATGCTSTATESVTVFGANIGGQITGYLWKDTFNFIPADGLVYLIEYDSTNGSLTAIDTVPTQQGLFNFINVPAGDYLVKAALETTDPDYANYLPTYYVQSLSWNTAQYVGPAPFGLVFIDIQLVAGNNPGGPGFIGGLVVNGAGRPVNGNQTLVENIFNMDPIEGVSVLLLDANGNAVTHTTTDEDGAYSFNGIAMGTYNVHVEEVGKVTFPATVVVDADNKTHTEVHFTVHESMVTLTGVYEVSNIEGLNVFPNPVSDAATVQIELAEAMDLTLTVTNLMGQEVINTNKNLFAGENSFSVEMNDLPTGLYLMSLKSGSDVVTYKIQKN
jgi:PKD repeat protein